MISAFTRGQSTLGGCLRVLTNSTSRNVAHSSLRFARPSNLLYSATISRPFSATLHPHNAASAARAVSNDAAEPLITKFAELGEKNIIATSIVNTLTKDMRLETLTPVQVQTINECLNGGDVIAQARTGTGKTLAFLIPILQRIINEDPSLAERGSLRRKADTRALIISPTRELAEQIAEEARKVTRNTALIVRTAVGGTNKAQGLREIQRSGCHILVGTPGRLNDILSDPYSGVRTPNLQAFVLDEADRLLDQGFGPEIQKIEKLLPNRNQVDRQTLMFSATVPKEVIHMVDSIMKDGYRFVQTIQAGEAQTHTRVPQMLVPLNGMENTIPAIMELAKREIKKRTETNEPPFKAIVFFNANAEATLAAATFESASRPRGSNIGTPNPFHPAIVVEMHSRLTQQARTRNAEQFRRATSAILFSSDVTSRGMDFPNVTHVIQAGIPNNVDTYVHRLGRTARGDKTGEGWLLATPIERTEVRRRLQGMNLKPDMSIESANVDMTKEAQLPAHVAQTLTEAVNAAKEVNIKLKSDAYKATLGVYQWYQRKQEVIDMMNARSKFGWGLQTPPGLSRVLATKLGLSRLHGVEIQTLLDDRRSDNQGQRGPQGFSSRDRDPNREPRRFPRAQGFEAGRDFGRRGQSHGSRGQSGRDFSRRGQSYGSGRESGQGRQSYGRDRGDGESRSRVPEW